MIRVELIEADFDYNEYIKERVLGGSKREKEIPQDVGLFHDDLFVKVYGYVEHEDYAEASYIVEFTGRGPRRAKERIHFGENAEDKSKVKKIFRRIQLTGQIEGIAPRDIDLSVRYGGAGSWVQFDGLEQVEAVVFDEDSYVWDELRRRIYDCISAMRKKSTTPCAGDFVPRINVTINIGRA